MSGYHDRYLVESAILYICICLIRTFSVVAFTNKTSQALPNKTASEHFAEMISRLRLAASGESDSLALTISLLQHSNYPKVTEMQGV